MRDNVSVNISYIDGHFLFLFWNVRDATQSPEKSPIFSPLKIGGGRGVDFDFGKIETKDSASGL